VIPGHPDGPSRKPVNHQEDRTTASALRYGAERRYAASLDAKGLPWVYEPTLFRFAGQHYTPDFYLPIQDVYVEVIGSRQRWHQLASKILSFRAHFPDVTLQVVSGEGVPWPPEARRRTPPTLTAEEDLEIALAFGMSADELTQDSA